MIGQLERAARVARTVRDAAADYDAGLVATGRRALRVVRGEGFSMEEAATLGILDPRAPASELGRFASRKRLRPLQHRLNPHDLTPLTEDKVLFQRMCERLGLPVPRLHALFYGGATGWGEGDVVLVGREAWIDHIDHVLPREFVVKPTHGHLGILVRHIRRDEGGFVDGTGARFTAAELDTWMRAQPQFTSFLVQERLYGHAALQELSGTTALQTIRVVTLVDRDRVPRVLFAGLKVITGDSPADNLHDGKTGNAVGEIDLQSGRLIRVAGPGPGARDLVELRGHPRTNVPFTGYQLPFWEETRELLDRTALEFLPLRTIGWDVALTAAGPVLIEGNAWWGPAPPNFLRTTSAIVKALEDAVDGRRAAGSARA